MINSLVLLAVVIFLLFSLREEKTPSIVYVNNTEVFSNFKLTQDLQAARQGPLRAQKRRVDSIVSLLEGQGKGASPTTDLEASFVKASNQLKEMESYYSQEVRQQVWSRVNTYIKAFGRQRGYAIILGAQGTGNVMYGEAALDVTDAFLEYANSKYEGGGDDR